MGTLFRTIVRKSASPTFVRSFALILIVQVVTILTAWLLLDSNVSRWTRNKALQAVRISQTLAAAEDWSLLDTIPMGRPSPLSDSYRRLLTNFSHRYFTESNGGDIYLAVVQKGRIYTINPDDPIALDDAGKANKWELAAYATGKTTYNDVPYTDENGTYLAAQTPIYRNGKVIGLLGAEYDSSSLAELQGIVQISFWLSVLPAILLAMMLAYVLAAMFVEPMEIFRLIDETAARDGAADSVQSGTLTKLSPREQEVAELVRRGMKNREIAAALVVTPETVKQHLKNIKEKTGFTRVDLAVHLEASRSRAALGSAAPA